MTTITLPIRLESEANKRGSWHTGARRAKAQRRTAALLLRAQLGAPPPPPLRITLTRIAPRSLDSDNLARAFKAVRDGVADWLGHDDGSPLLAWEYAQRKGAPREHAVESTLEAAPDLARERPAASRTRPATARRAGGPQIPIPGIGDAASTRGGR